MNNDFRTQAGEKPLSRVFDKRGKLSIFTVAVSVILLAALIVLNLLVSLIPKTATVFDTTTNSLFSLSETTERFVREIGEEVTIYWLCSGGNESSGMRTFLDRYTAANGKIRVIVKDPVKDPNFITQYTDASLSNYSVIVESARRAKTVDYADMSYFSNGTDRLTTEEYAYYYQMYGEYMTSYYGFSEYFGGDSAITGAIEYVIAGKVPTVYLLNGHYEAAFSTRVTDACFTNTGIPVKELNIALDDAIPADCTCLIINAPQTDITAGEAAKLNAYLADGGKLLLLTDPGADADTNLMSVMQKYGMSAAAGTISEGDAAKYYSRNPQYILPSINQEHTAVAAFVESQSYYYNFGLLMPGAHGIAVLGAEGVTVTPLLSTSESASTDQNAAKQSYALAAVAEKGSSAVMWIASSQLLGDSFVTYSQGGNMLFFYCLLSWSCDSFSSSLPEIEAIQMTSPVLTVTETQANLWGNFFALLVPAAVVAVGIVVVVRRRRHA